MAEKTDETLEAIRGDMLRYVDKVHHAVQDATCETAQSGLRQLRNLLELVAIAAADVKKLSRFHGHGCACVSPYLPGPPPGFRNEAG